MVRVRDQSRDHAQNGEWFDLEMSCQWRYLLFVYCDSGAVQLVHIQELNASLGEKVVEAFPSLHHFLQKCIKNPASPGATNLDLGLGQAGPTIVDDYVGATETT